MQHFKILPLLVFVAMLAFSVRLMDVVSGVSSLSGAAHAKKEAPAEPADPPSSHEKEGKTEDSSSDHGTEPDKGSASEAAHEDSDEAEMDWRDAGDEDLSYMNVRKNIFKDLSVRRAKIEAQEKTLVTREALLKVAGKELDRKYRELSQLRTEIEGLLDNQKDEESSRIQSLVKIYEGMKPKDAARIFNTLDLDVLLSVMSRMSERKLSPVLAAMNPERARTMTIMLAEEKQLPSLPDIR